LIRVIAPRSRGKERKPFCLDVTSWFLLTAFERWIALLGAADALHHR